MVAPSPSQFVVNYNGKDYTYSSVQGSDVTIGSVPGTQYDYLIGTGGVSGYSSRERATRQTGSSSMKYRPRSISRKQVS